MRLKYVLVLFIAISFIKSAYSQKTKSQTVSNVITANIIFPGISYEQKVTKVNTFHLSVYINPILTAVTSSGSPIISSNSSHKTRVSVGPALDISFRTYYNFKRRYNAGKRTELNSLNYFAPAFVGDYTKPSTNSKKKFVSQIGVVWGIQRNYPSRFSLDFNIGIGYLTSADGASNNNSVWPMGQLRLGIWLNKKNKENK